MIPWRSFTELNEIYREAGFINVTGSAHQLLWSLIHSGESVLEIGCSAGYFSKRLKVEKNCFVVGVESDPRAADLARTHGQMEVFVPSTEKTELPAKYIRFFDVILCADVIEHTRDPWAVITELKAYASPECRFIFSIPNAAHWTCRLMLLRGKWEYQTCGLLDYTHLRFFTLKTALQLLSESGLKVRKVLYSFGPMDVYEKGIFRLFGRGRLRYLLNKSLRYLSRTIPSLFALQFIIEADVS